MRPKCTYGRDSAPNPPGELTSFRQSTYIYNFIRQNMTANKKEKKK